MKDENVLQWYKDHKIVADRIINDLRERSCGAVMHMYAYTSKLLQLEHVVSQSDFPLLFTNNYTRVGDRLSGVLSLLLGAGNIYLSPNKVRMSLKFWLLYGDLYETLVSKATIKAEESQERVKRKGWLDLRKQLVTTSVLNRIKSQSEWNQFFRDDDAVRGNEDIITEGLLEENSAEVQFVKEMPVELQTEDAQRYLNLAIGKGFCDKDFNWLKTKSLLAYFAECASDKLELSQAEQDGRKKVFWKPFETLFCKKGLSDCRNNYRNKSGSLPSGYEEVDSIFDL